jgi:tetratricopeptide (TPR) repeat protein
VSRPRLALALVAGAAAALPLASHADPPARRARPARDHDETAERASDFWAQAVRPGGADYDGLVDRARLLIQSGEAQHFAQAEELLEQAIALDAKELSAYGWLGELTWRQERWRRCAGALAIVFAADPSGAPAPLAQLWGLDLRLGDCLARAGDHEGAILHFKRLVAGGHGRATDASRRLGDSFMALGRLAEAIDAYHAALIEAPHRTHTYYTAALAYDRDEKLAHARQLLDIALRRDPKQSALLGNASWFVPPEDQLYARGLVDLVRGQRAWAVASFRAYVARTGAALWHGRARVHLAHLRELGFSRRDVDVSGGAALDRRRAEAAVLREAADLHECVEAVPGLLLTVRITVMAARAPAKPTRHGAAAAAAGAPTPAPAAPAIAPPESGVRITREPDFDPGGADAEAAIACVARIAERIALPAAVGARSTYATVSFAVIAR